jgi:hypothetical protein
MAENPFDPGANGAYRRWADEKRRGYELRARDDFPLLVDIDADGSIDDAAMSIIRDHVRRYNFALYRMREPSADHLAAVKHIGRQMGLRDLDRNLCAPEDRVTRLTVKPVEGARYIPYTNKPIGWHTDGYYNPMHQRVLAMVLHCQQPAAEGGVNQLLDHDMAYIHLRDEDPAFVEALSRPRVMCIPPNVVDGEELRPQTCSAVFMTEQEAPQQAPALTMRFSKRKHNIIWAGDNRTREALHCLFEFLESDSPWHVRYRLNAGEGVINNNVLHTRSGFRDDAANPRIYYRARYYNRINIQ